MLGDSSSRQPGIAAAYDQWSALYDDNVNATRDLDAVVLRRAPLGLTGRRVLELGCGTGKNSVWLAQRAASLLALDFSAEMLARARDRVRSANARFVQQDILQPWPADSATLDVVVGNLVLEHIESLAPIFVEAARVLRPGGQLFLSELHPYRQLRGVQARFVHPTTQETVLVPAFSHSVSDYVNGAIAAGFSLRSMDEAIEVGAEAGARPRILSLLFDRV